MHYAWRAAFTYLAAATHQVRVKNAQLGMRATNHARTHLTLDAVGAKTKRKKYEESRRTNRAARQSRAWQRRHSSERERKREEMRRAREREREREKRNVILRIN